MEQQYVFIDETKFNNFKQKVPAELIQQLQVQHNSNSGVVTTTGSGDQIQITYTTGLTDGSSHVVEYDEDGQLQVSLLL